MDKRDIFITHGSDIKHMTKSLLKSVDVCKLIGNNKDAYIGLKPNLVVAAPSTQGATTTPLIVRTIAKYLMKHGYKNLCIIESSWIGEKTERAVRACGYDKICAELDIEFIDVKKDDYKTFTVDGLKIEMSKQTMALDFLINIPVLKGHCQTSLTCALKNMKGCISDTSKRYFHTKGLHAPIAALASIRSADLVIVDSLNGDLDFEEGGNPVQTNRMLAGVDSVLIDAYCAGLLGYEVCDIPYIKYAENYGVGCGDPARANVITLDEPRVENRQTSTKKVKKLEEYITEKDACSACYANLIHALRKIKPERLNSLPPIYIGQAFKDKSKEGVGVGKCCGKFDDCIRGCPPKPTDIVKHLKSLI